MKKVIFYTFSTLFFLVFLTKNVSAQDKHLTQFYAAPLTLNPALTGVFEGKYRVSAIYRDQWRRVLDHPIKTFAIGGDFRFKAPGSKKVKKDAIGLGLLLFNDKVSVVDFSTTQIAVSGAYHMAMDYDNRQFLSLGIQGGLGQRNINYASLNFHDEFDGINGYTLATLENLPENNFSYGDFNVGMNYTAKIGENGGIYAGMAMHHILEPHISFYGDTSNNFGQKLYKKLSAQLSATIPIRHGFSISPRFLIAAQGPHLEMNTGANLRFAMGEYGGNVLQFGSWVRPVRNEGGIGVDAVILLAGIEVGQVICGISYDLNIRALSTARSRQGAFEISLTYLGEYENEEILCPKF